MKKQRNIYQLKSIAVEFAKIFVKDFEILYVENSGNHGYADFIRFDGYYFIIPKTLKKRKNKLPKIVFTVCKKLNFEFRKYEFKDGIINFNKIEIIKDYDKEQVISILKKHNFI